jgi:hypothetical protein
VQIRCTGSPAITVSGDTVVAKLEERKRKEGRSKRAMFMEA